MTGLDWLYTAGSWTFAFVGMLGVLVFAHELGHFLVAKACGVRVLKFSMGFGPPIGIGKFKMRWERGHTEYVVSWIPLGGFVKVLGEVPDESDDEIVKAHPSETLGAKPLWQKLAFVFAGPAMNLLLPVVIFTGILWVGLPQADSLIGEVEPGSAAAIAGLEPGDRITSIDGHPVTWWRDVDETLSERTSGPIQLGYRRDENDATASVNVRARGRTDMFGEALDVGWVGIYHRRPLPIIGFDDRTAPGYVAGLRTGDTVVSVADIAVDDWYALERSFSAAAQQAGSSAEIAIEIRRGAETAQTRIIEVPAAADIASLGILRADVLIAEVAPDSAADEAGLEAGDLIVSVDGNTMSSFDTFAAVVLESRGRTLSLEIARDGERSQVDVAPRLVKTDVTGIGIEVDRYRIGIVGTNLLTLEGETRIEKIRNPFESVPRAAGLSLEITRLFLRGLGKLFAGEVSRDQISGPIGIAEIAGKALERGWMDYLHTMILISINLGIINLLPIPILDGGQALVFLVEGVRRAPLTLRTREFVQQIGVTMLLVLMGFAFWNDISRNWSTFVDWLAGGS